MPRRRRSAMELVSAFAHLENMGLAPRILVEDLGTDPTGRLKLVGFGSSPRKPSAHKIVQYEADTNKRGNHSSERWQKKWRQHTSVLLAVYTKFSAGSTQTKKLVQSSGLRIAKASERKSVEGLTQSHRRHLSFRTFSKKPGC
jgi:hypothetical protein